MIYVYLLASVAEQANLNLTCLKIPEDTFLCDVAQELFCAVTQRTCESLSSISFGDHSLAYALTV